MIYDIESLECLTYIGYTEDNIHSYLHMVSKKLIMHYFWTGIKIKHMQEGNNSINHHNTLIASGKFTWNASNKYIQKRSSYHYRSSLPSTSACTKAFLSKQNNQHQHYGYVDNKHIHFTFISHVCISCVVMRKCKATSELHCIST